MSPSEGPGSPRHGLGGVTCLHHGLDGGDVQPGPAVIPGSEINR